MFDPSEMYPQGFHPTKPNRTRDFKGKAKRYTRTQQPPRYYLIDFGLSRQYLSREVLDEPLRGGDKSAPEHRNGTWCNPFYTDIYYLGNLVRQEFMRVRLRYLVHRGANAVHHQKYYGFGFMHDLVAEMTHTNPSKRPSIEDVVAKFSLIRESLSSFKLRSPIISKHDPSLFSVFRCAKQIMHTLQDIVLHSAAVPEP